MMSEPAAICPECGAPCEEESGLCRRCLVAQVLMGDREEDEDVETDMPLGEIGDYEILEKIAQGGMGIVYRARQKGLGREVAVKLIPEGRLASQSEVQRFRMEAEAAAELNHPNIVSVHEIGEEDGQHFYSMRLIEGGSLREHVDEFGGEPRKATELIVKIVRAVHFAHQHGILHRDLKPGNILIDRHGEPQIMDFGLAKRVDADPHLTMTGQVLGSPAFMAPELLTGTGSASVLSEVYSLGVILYQLLAGHVPFDGTSQLAIIRHVADSEVPRLAGIDRDLETICLKSLEKQPVKRYASAAFFADDLERWLERRPIQARAVTRMERMIKWVRRKPAVAALIAVSLIAAAVSWVILLNSNMRITEERNRALESERDTRVQLYVSDMAAVQRALTAGNLFQARGILTRHVPRPEMEDLRGFEWRHFWLQCQSDETFSLPTRPAHAIQSVDFSPDGKVMAVGGKDFVYLFDAQTRECLKRFPEDVKYDLIYTLKREVAVMKDDLFLPQRKGGRQLSEVYSTTFLGGENGDRMLLGGGEDHATIWNWKTAKIDTWIPLDCARIVDVPGTDWLAAGTGWRELETVKEGMQLIDRTTLKAVGPEFLGAGGLVDVSADGQTFLTGDAQGNLKIFHQNGKLVASAKFKTSVTSVSLSPDGSMVAAAIHPEETVFLWDVAAKKISALRKHSARAWCVDFSPDGETIASTGADQTICLWDVKTRKLKRRLTGHTSEVLVVKFSPDGQWLLSGGRDSHLKIWDMVADDQTDFFPRLSWPAEFLPDSRKLLATSLDGGLRVLDLEGGAPIDIVLYEIAKDFRFDAEGKVLQAVTQEAENPAECFFRTWSTESWEPVNKVKIQRVESAFEAPMSRISTDGKSVAVVTAMKRKKFATFDWETGKEGESVSVNNLSTTPTSAIFDSAGNLWFTIWPDQLQMRSGDGVVHDILQFPGESKSLALSENWIASGLGDGRVCVYDRKSSELKMTLMGHLDDVIFVAFSPDEECLASVSEDRTLRLWSLRAKREITVLSEGHLWKELAFSPDGKVLLATGWGGGLQLWRAPDLQEIDTKPTLFR